jgi:hypothetical protein
MSLNGGKLVQASRTLISTSSGYYIASISRHAKNTSTAFFEDYLLLCQLSHYIRQQRSISKLKSNGTSQRPPVFLFDPFGGDICIQQLSRPQFFVWNIVRFIKFCAASSHEYSLTSSVDAKVLVLLEGLLLSPLTALSRFEFSEFQVSSFTAQLSENAIPSRQSLFFEIIGDPSRFLLFKP